MESRRLDREDPPTNPVEEIDDQPDGRSYDCVYCKHGFTTAQALGGHMNVHRKDRAKSSRSNSSNNKRTPYTGTQLYYQYQPCLITSCSPNHHQEGQTRDLMSRSSPVVYDHSSHDELKHANKSTTIPSQEEIRLSLSLSLQFGRSHEEESIRGLGGNEDDELDLELRLGYDP